MASLSREQACLSLTPEYPNHTIQRVKQNQQTFFNNVNHRDLLNNLSIR